jgi:hypothetical protein
VILFSLPLPLFSLEEGFKEGKMHVPDTCPAVD